MSRPSDDVRLLTISNTVSDRLKSLPADYEAASALIASAAFQVGFTRIAAGLAQEMAGPKGDTYIHERFAPEQFDVLQLAPIDFASRTALTCLDLCAAAAYRLRRAGRFDRHGESDLEHLREAIRKNGVQLHEGQERWRQALVGDNKFRLLKLVRDQVTHRALERHTTIGEGPPKTTITIEGKPYDGTVATLFADFAESQYQAFTTAVLADYPDRRSPTQNN